MTATGRWRRSFRSATVAVRARGRRRRKPTDRTDDPVRMYLREMGSVELLSREGEIAIAKRIEAGREAMIAGLCESPLTFQAIIIWRDELIEGRVLLRDIIDLEATYAGPGREVRPRTPGDQWRRRRHRRRDARPERARKRRSSRRRRVNRTTTTIWRTSVSLAAMEAEIKPKVHRDLRPDRQQLSRSLRRLQVEHVEQRLAEQGTLTPSPGTQVLQVAQGRGRSRTVKSPARSISQPRRSAWWSSSTISTSGSIGSRRPVDAARRDPTESRATSS